MTDAMFKGLINLQTVVLPEGLIAISDEAFSGCTGLTSINIPTTVEAIGVEAFLNCGLITSIEFDPTGNLSIGNRAFQNCAGLTSVDVSKAIRIGYGAFNGCSKLARIEISFAGASGGQRGIFGHIFNSTLDNPGTPPNETLGNSDSVVPPSLKTIVFWGTDLSGNGSDGAFRGCNNITTFIIRGAATNIAADAFNGCTLLSSIVIPESVTTIYNGAFSGCGIANIYYGGTSAQWGGIINNGVLGGTTKYYAGQWGYDPVTGLPRPN
jgi:hypothetical protein